MSGRETAITCIKDIDFDIYSIKAAKYECSDKHCDCLQRICVGMRYTQLLNGDIDNNKDKLIKFNTQTYTDFLNDYIHILKSHDSDLQKIAADLVEKYGYSQCNISQCKQLKRHYRRNRKEEKSDNDSDNGLYDFFASHYDQLRHVIFHLFRMGLRTELKGDSQEHKAENDGDIDLAFAAKRDLIKSQRKKYNLEGIERYNDENNKYNINGIVGAEIDSVSEGNTFLDAMYQQIEEHGDISNNKIMALKQYILDNEYDSNSIKNDLECSELNESNISRNIMDNLCVKTIKQFIRFSQCMDIYIIFLYFNWIYNNK